MYYYNFNTIISDFIGTIINLLMIPGDVGKNLLLCLEVVCSASKQVVDNLVADSLPSTLVKCIYIFYDLPPPQNNLELNERQVSSVLSCSVCSRYRYECLYRYECPYLNAYCLTIYVCACHSLITKETTRAQFRTTS